MIFNECQGVKMSDKLSHYIDVAHAFDWDQQFVKNKGIDLAKELLKLKFTLCATRGTAEYIRKHGMKCKIINKVTTAMIILPNLFQRFSKFSCFISSSTSLTKISLSLLESAIISTTCYNA